MSVNYYAVAKGKSPGIYLLWSECEEQVKGFSGAIYKKFKSRQLAIDFIAKFSSETIQLSENIKKRKLKIDNLDIDEGDCYPSDQLIANIKRRKVTPNNSRVHISNYLVIYIDGACSDNGDPLIAKAGIGVWFGQDDSRNISERLPGKLQTNNRAEVYAAVRALETISDSDIAIEFMTDSKYLIGCMTKWYKDWERTNWKNNKILNRPLLEHLLLLKKKRKGPIRWTYVKAHSGEYGNECADKLAVNGAKKDVIKSDSVPPFLRN